MLKKYLNRRDARHRAPEPRPQVARGGKAGATRLSAGGAKQAQGQQVSAVIPEAAVRARPNPRTAGGVWQKIHRQQVSGDLSCRGGSRNLGRAALLAPSMPGKGGAPGSNRAAAPLDVGAYLYWRVARPAPVHGLAPQPDSNGGNTAMGAENTAINPSRIDRRASARRLLGSRWYGDPSRPPRGGSQRNRGGLLPTVRQV